MLIVLVYMAEVCDPTLLSYTFVCCNLRCFVGGGALQMTAAIRVQLLDALGRLGFGV